MAPVGTYGVELLGHGVSGSVPLGAGFVVSDTRVSSSGWLTLPAALGSRCRTG